MPFYTRILHPETKVGTGKFQLPDIFGVPKGI